VISVQNKCLFHHFWGLFLRPPEVVGMKRWSPFLVWGDWSTIFCYRKSAHFQVPQKKLHSKPCVRVSILTLNISPSPNIQERQIHFTFSVVFFFNHKVPSLKRRKLNNAQLATIWDILINTVFCKRDHISCISIPPASYLHLLLLMLYIQGGHFDLVVKLEISLCPPSHINIAWFLQ